MLIPSQVFPISKMCDVESTRRISARARRTAGLALGGVRIERDKDGPIAIVTDGRRLLSVRWPETPSKEFPIEETCKKKVKDFACIIPKKAWDDAGMLPPKRSPRPVLTNVLLEEGTANGTVKMVATDLETTRSVEPRVLEGRYPKWRDVDPNYSSDEVTTITLDPTYVKEMLLTLETIQKIACDEEARGVDFIVPHDNSRPVVLQVKRKSGLEATGVIMPLNRDS